MADVPQTGQPDEPERREPGPFGPGGLFGPGGFDLAQIDLEHVLRIVQSPGPVNWEVAREVARAVARGETTEEPAVDPVDHAQLDELVRAAQTLVVAETGLTATFGAPLRTLVPSAWAELQLDALRPVLEALAVTLQGAMGAESGAGPELGGADVLGPKEGEEPGGPFGLPMSADAFVGMMRMLAPMLLGAQAGSMVGYLAQHALGRYDLPLPTSDPPSLCFVVANLDAFELEWSIARDDLRFTVALHEVVRAAERSVPWVQKRLVRLAIEYVSAYEADADAFEARFGDLDPNDPAALAALAEQPDALLGAIRSPRQHEILDRIQEYTSVLEGYADGVVARVGARLVPSYARIHEAMQRHHVERGEAGRFIEGLLGLQLERAHYERGEAFCAGVLERAGPEGLNRLWEGESMLPTPAEIDAPGLWLARIDLPHA